MIFVEVYYKFNVKTGLSSEKTLLYEPTYEGCFFQVPIGHKNRHIDITKVLGLLPNNF